LPTGCRILVADDNAVSGQLVATLLEARGASVTLAQDGREAWEHLLAGPFHLVLMDLHMPELDGTQVTARLRAFEAGARHTPIVALTADAFDDTRRYVLQAGLDDYLVKPVEEPALFAMVSRWLAARRGGGAAPGADKKAGGAVHTPAPPIDREAALRAAAGREGLANELLGMLVGDLREQQERIAGALADGDLTALAEIAHSLAGGAAYCGARPLHDVARALQQAARAHDSEDVARHALALEVEAERLTRAAAAYLERSDAVRATGPAAGRERE
jgi:two-component system sensor histidine kinase BarA